MPSSYERNVSEIGEVDEKGNDRDVFTKISPSYAIQKAAQPDRLNEGGYYGLPILKRPAWKWEIALYFFFEGISGGSYVLCTVASLLGGKRHARAIRTGRYLSFFTMLLCPPLLIIDLGRPERFHHMLRIWKKTSPMNHGAWYPPTTFSASPAFNNASSNAPYRGGYPAASAPTTFPSLSTHPDPSTNSTL